MFNSQTQFCFLSGLQQGNIEHALIQGDRETNALPPE